MSLPTPQRENLQNCILLALDFDGLFTNNKVRIDENGIESVECDRSDTIGLPELEARKVKVMIITTEEKPIAKFRADKIGIECLCSVKDKGKALLEEMKKLGITKEQVVAVGNDVNDIAMFMVAGFRIAPANAHPDISPYIDHVLQNRGGDGAVREVFGLILKAKQESETVPPE